MKALILLSGVTATVSAFQLQCPLCTCHNHVGARYSQHGVSPSLQLSMMAATFVNIDENAPRDVTSMEEWASSYGVQKADAFQLTTDETGDVSAMTTEDLPPDTTVLFVPNDLILSSNQAMQELGRVEAAEDLLARLEAADDVFQFYLFLKVLVEYERGDESPYFPWFNSLPRWYSNGASMTPFCYECLPPLVAKLAMGERTKFIYFCEALKQVDFISQEVKNNKDVAKWAYQIVFTRSFETPDDVRIVPMADMFNHGNPETEIDISYDDEGNCYAYTTTNVAAGSPLRISYGSPTNPSQLFARYGFLDKTSPATFCKVMISPITPGLVDMGYDYSRMLFYTENGAVSEEVWDVLLYRNLEDNREEQRIFYEAHVNEDYNIKQAMHDRYWPETLATLQNHVNSFLAQLDELSGKAVGMDVNEHPRLPLILEHNDFVKNTFLKVQSTL